MRAPRSLALVGLGLLATACADGLTEPTAEAAAPTVASLVDPQVAAAVGSGETFSYTTIDGSATRSLSVGGTLQLTNTLHYSLGGTLTGASRTFWMSTNDCIATVTNEYPSWGLVKGIKAGTVKLIATAYGKADTVTVTVTGTTNLAPSCSGTIAPLPSTDLSMGTPSATYGVKAGERMTRIVLFAPKSALAVGAKTQVVAEAWYSGGGKMRANYLLQFLSTDGSVASVTTAGGVTSGTVTARKLGAARIVAKLGQFADTVPVFIR